MYYDTIMEDIHERYDEDKSSKDEKMFEFGKGNAVHN
jgi:hypothetical protein